MALALRVDISRAKSSAVGKEHGITTDELQELQPVVESAHKTLQYEREQGIYGFWNLHRDNAAVENVKQAANRFLSHGFDNLVVLGIGGSALGATALFNALAPPYHNLLSKRRRKGHPRLLVMDNIDPTTFKVMLKMCPPEKTLYNVVSKSGGTAETISQLMIVLEVIERKLGRDAVKEHVVVTTNPRSGDPKNPASLLHLVTDEYGLEEFVIPKNVGGRFSVFTPVGLFPAAMLGIDVDGLLDGCAAMDTLCTTSDLAENPAYTLAAVHYLADTRKGKPMCVMMPYSDALRSVADWFRQLWAESLGKRYSLDGQEVFAGQTPINALGATDQHSQIQLYREGPNDKLITTVEVGSFGGALRVPEVLTSIGELDYLRGSTMNKLMAAELRGTIDALKISQRPVCRVLLPKVNESTVGQLLYMFEVQTAMAGRLYNVNTFDQPGVEEGKVIARNLMGAER